MAAAAHRRENGGARLVRAEVVRAGLVNRGRAVAVRRSLEGAGELIKGLASDVATGVEARPRRFRGQDVVAVRIGSSDKGNRHASGRVVWACHVHGSRTAEAL